jgi:uncharacterized protein
MELRGTVLNVVDFGAFVDVGLKESGLVHVSQMAAQFVRSPHDVVSVGDVVTVWVLSVDAERKRVSLGMIKPGTPVPQRGRRPDRKAIAPAVTSAAAPAHGAGSTAAPATEVPVPSIVAEQPAETGTETPVPVATPRPAVKRPHHQKQGDRKAAPLSPAALTGDEPLRTFGQLKQFWNKKSQ